MANLFDIAVARKLSGGGGGGNPNTEQTVTGTLANPWGDIDPVELTSAIGTRDADASITIDASALGAGTVYGRLGATNHLYVTGANLTDSTMAYEVIYDLVGVLYSAKMLSGGQVVDISQYASVLPATIVVVWHPLPDTPPIPPT